MSAAKHTPGPWEAVGAMVRTPFVLGDPEQRGWLIAECAMGCMPSGENARLIAAAPELLVELRALAKTAHNHFTVPESVWAAIAKATGEASHG